MKSTVLQTREIPDQHTGVNILERLLEATRNWNFSNDLLVTIVHDNTAYIVLVLELNEEWNSSHCFGHTLQLAVNLM